MSEDTNEPSGAADQSAVGAAAAAAGDGLTKSTVQPPAADLAEPEAGPVAGIVAQIEAMVRAAEKTADAELHAILNDVHVMAADLKSKVARVKTSLEGDAHALVSKLHDLL